MSERQELARDWAEEATRDLLDRDPAGEPENDFDVPPPVGRRSAWASRPCPECAQGKHTNCTGDAWDHVRDQIALCPCWRIHWKDHSK